MINKRNKKTRSKNPALASEWGEKRGKERIKRVIEKQQHYTDLHMSNLAETRQELKKSGMDPRNKYRKGKERRINGSKAYQQ